MPEHIKALAIILFFGIFVFYISRKALDPSLQNKDFERWRNAWAILTIIPFLAGNFWLFMIASTLALLYLVKKVEDRFAFFVVLFLVVPPYELRIPGLFDLSYTRMLTLAILLPMFISKKWRQETPPLGKPLADKLIIALLILVVLLQMRGTTPGDSLRTGVVYFIDWFLPYFIASRAIRNFNQLKTVLIALTIASSIAGIIGFFEHAKAWLLYNPLPRVLNVAADRGGYLMRGDDLRAMASLGHPLSLGVIMMIAIGIYFFIAPLIESRKLRWGLLIGVAAGLYAPVSRGPWLASAVVILTLALTGRKKLKKLSLLMVGALIVLLTLPYIPGSQKIINLMPFIGTSEQFNVEYRQELIPRAISIIEREPLFGVFEAAKEPEMSDMLQGEGQVDIVNSYLNISLSYGLVGLTLFLWFFLLAIYRLRKSMKYIKDKRSEEYLCGQSLFAIMIGFFVVLSSISFIGTITSVIYILAGIIFSYHRIITNLVKKQGAVVD